MPLKLHTANDSPEAIAWKRLSHEEIVALQKNKAKRSEHCFKFARAAQQNDEAEIVRLKAAGANIRDIVPISGGMIPFHELIFTCIPKEKRVQAFKLLVKHGADPLVSCDPLLHNAAARGQEMVIELLLTQYNANPNQLDTEGKTALHQLLCCAHLGDKVQIAKLLIKAGMDINLCSFDGSTALHAAAAGNEKAVVRLLLDYGATPNKQNKWGYTAISWSVRDARPKMIRLLVANGADLTVRDKNGYTLLDLALLPRVETAKLPGRWCSESINRVEQNLSETVTTLISLGATQATSPNAQRYLAANRANIEAALSKQRSCLAWLRQYLNTIFALFSEQESL